MAGRYVEMVRSSQTPPEYQGVRFLSIGPKGVAGYYEFEAFSAIS